MKHLANRNILVAMLSFAIASAMCLPSQAQFATGLAEDSPVKPELDTKNAVLQVYPLDYIPAGLAAEHLDFLLGKGLARISHDTDRNLLLVITTVEIHDRIIRALQTLDVPVKKKTSHSKLGIPSKTLQVHTFWLADDLIEDEGRLTTGFLPNSVYHVLQKLGLESPRIVAQSTSSLIASANSGDDKNFNQFASKMSATINGRALQFESRGNLYHIGKKQIDLHMGTIISRTSHVPKHGLAGHGLAKFNECEVEGSLTAPLGHYMVLGTANYVGRPDANEPQKVGSKPGKLASSRFAFVIQVVEASSFAPEK